MTDTKAETIDADVETMDPPEEASLVPQDQRSELTTDQIDSVTQIASKIEAYGKAMDTIMNVIIKRSYEGDWVCHDRAGSNEEERKANIGAAAAERIASFLGIQESNWTRGSKEWSDDKQHYTWIYEADFSFGKRTIHAIGRAGTRDKLFGFANGQWKPLADVQEDHIRAAAFRACRKEGVRQLLGLRNIPAKKLKELGYDIGKIANAGFEDRGKTLSADQKKATDGLISRKVKIKEAKRVEGKSEAGKAWSRWDVVDVENVKYSFFGGADSKRAAILQDAHSSGDIVELFFQVKTFNNQEKYEIVKVNGVVDA